MYHPVRLVRESTKPMPNGSPLTIGELLKNKVQEGVRAIVLLWDDKTSHDKFHVLQKVAVVPTPSECAL